MAEAGQQRGSMGQGHSSEGPGLDETLAGFRGQLRLTEDEGQRLALPGGLWHADSDTHNLCLVGRLLSSRVPRFEAFGTSVQGTINPVKGCLWSFEKNVIILSEIDERENPLRVNLDWCDFHIHVHELPLSMMNLGVATLIGNRIGRFRDMDMDDTGCDWGATLRLRVAINVTRPLPRAIPIVSTMRDELLVHLTYKRLPNFCYLCGKLGHIAKYCELQFEARFVDPRSDTPYGPWLRAPLPIRGRVQSFRRESGSASTPTASPDLSRARGAAVFGNFSGQARANCGQGSEDSVRDSAEQGARGLEVSSCGIASGGVLVPEAETSADFMPSTIPDSGPPGPEGVRPARSAVWVRLDGITEETTGMLGAGFGQ
ncbi:hypothetical protein Salat_1464200 [Sesamum alatum]|uniref:CCHC-type domain-containing protein n=1 Tax=Sesamum alatum TaxID=300844 RepID=A0AAE1YB15_9LAMI|nr:hypothetical protein Salat_1464200 [Sesamum alatum]